MRVMQGQGPAWFGAQWIPPIANVYAAECASACTEFCGGPRSGCVPNLGVNPMNQIEQLQITNPEVILHGIRCEGLLRLLQAAGEGCNSLHVPTPGMRNVEGGSTIRALLTEFLRGFSLFLLDMVLPQLDAYHSGRQLQHLQPWVSVELAQQLDSFSCILREPQSCSSVIQWPSPNAHRGTYVRLVI